MQVVRAVPEERVARTAARSLFSLLWGRM